METLYERVFWSYGGYGMVEGVWLLFPDRQVRGFFSDSTDDITVAIVTGNWRRDSDVYSLTCSFTALSHRRDRPPVLCPVSDAEAWGSLPTYFSFPVPEQSPHLPELICRSFSIGRFESGSRVLFGN